MPISGVSTPPDTSEWLLVNFTHNSLDRKNDLHKVRRRCSAVNYFESVKRRASIASHRQRVHVEFLKVSYGLLFLRIIGYLQGK